jgi:hypothetical protein
MKIMRNAFFTIDTRLAGGVPVSEEHIACYVYKEKIKVDIRKHVELPSGDERYVCKMSDKRKHILVLNDLEKFCATIEAMGYQLGDHMGEGVELTDLGQQEVSLLTSVPYLFTKDTKQVKR